jgi:hypothetical protein
MDLKRLQDKLLAAARLGPANEAVPYAFEQRVMARLRSARVVDVASAWGAALWKGALACIVVTLLSGAWALYSSSTQAQDDLSQDLEQAVVAVADAQLDEAW